jgi:hypothetical protein
VVKPNENDKPAIRATRAPTFAVSHSGHTYSISRQAGSPNNCNTMSSRQQWMNPYIFAGCYVCPFWGRLLSLDGWLAGRVGGWWVCTMGPRDPGAGLLLKALAADRGAQVCVRVCVSLCAYGALSISTTVFSSPRLAAHSFSRARSLFWRAPDLLFVTPATRGGRLVSACARRTPQAGHRRKLSGPKARLEYAIT